MSFMTPSAKNPNIPFTLWQQRELIIELTRRELSQRYRGSFLGFLWSLIVPLLMLVIYTFVFSTIFQARWSSQDSPTPSSEYALIMFVGLTAFNIFSEVVTRSTSLIPNMPNYVKKVAFPLEIYPLVILIASVILSLVNILLIVIGNLLLTHSLPSAILLLPLAYLPLILISIGLGWFVASLGVYIRDLAQIMPVIVTILFFLSPIVYPISMVPQGLQPLLYLNPLTTIVEGFRQVLLWNGCLPWSGWGICTIVSLVIAVIGYIWFMGTKKGFADVL
jgi:lipopolysaccharide transport system permease protein